MPMLSLWFQHAVAHSHTTCPRWSPSKLFNFFHHWPIAQDLTSPTLQSLKTLLRSLGYLLALFVTLLAIAHSFILGNQPFLATLDLKKPLSCLWPYSNFSHYRLPDFTFPISSPSWWLIRLLHVHGYCQKSHQKILSFISINLSINHVGDFTSILHSHTSLVPQALGEMNLDQLRLFHQWECLECHGHMLSVSCVKWP